MSHFNGNEMQFGFHQCNAEIHAAVEIATDKNVNRHTDCDTLLSFCRLIHTEGREKKETKPSNEVNEHPLIHVKTLQSGMDYMCFTWIALM